MISILCSPGTSVKKGQVLINLDAKILMAQEKQAIEGLEYAKNTLSQNREPKEEAKAGFDQARSTYKRSQKRITYRAVPKSKLL